MNFSHLYSSALDQELGTDDSTRLFITARRQRAINQAQLQFCDLTECAIRQSTVTCSNGTAEYNLLSTAILAPGDFLRISKQGPEYHHRNSASNVTYRAGPDEFPRREIPWLNQYDPGWRSTVVGTPTFYYERVDAGQRLFGLVPPPSINSSEAAQLLIPYVVKPSSMTNDTSVPFTFGSTTRDDLEPYHQALVHFAAADLEKLRLNYQASQAQMLVFMAYVERYRLAMQPKDGRQVRMGRNYFAESRRRRGQRGGDISVTAPFDY